MLRVVNRLIVGHERASQRHSTWSQADGGKANPGSWLRRLRTLCWAVRADDHLGTGTTLTTADDSPPPPTATVRRPDQSMAPLCDLRAGHDSTAPSRLAAHASPTATLLPPARAASRAQRSFCHARPPLLAGNYPLERRKARALRRGDWRSPYRRS